MGTDESSETATDTASAVVLDLMPRGRSEDDRPPYQRSPVALALGVADFGLYELRLCDDPDTTIGDRIAVGPEERDPEIEDLVEIGYADLTGGAQSELEYAVDEVVAADPDRFVDYYNEAQPITLRLHQLDLLPGVGETLRNAVLDERKRGPFADFEDVETRVSGLHDAREKIVQRIIEELRDEDVKYRAFVDTS